MSHVENFALNTDGVEVFWTEPSEFAFGSPGASSFPK